MLTQMNINSAFRAVSVEEISRHLDAVARDQNVNLAKWRIRISKALAIDWCARFLWRGTSSAPSNTKLKLSVLVCAFRRQNSGCDVYHDIFKVDRAWMRSQFIQQYFYLWFFRYKKITCKGKYCTTSIYRLRIARTENRASDWESYI